jgi:hypothetical protein
MRFPARLASRRKGEQFIPELSVFILMPYATERSVKIVRDAMRSPREQRKDVVRDAGSAFSISEMLLLDERAWEQFVAVLEGPPREIPELVKLFRAKAPWD